MIIEDVSGYSFRPADLKISERKPGISAFMRTRNGADFLEATIRSHVRFYDEIVVVFNQCTDSTEEILSRLTRELGPRLRVFHYRDRVQPLGSPQHAATPGHHPESMVNYSNFALAQTRHQIAVKLDDDHLAIPEPVEKIARALRAGQKDLSLLYCFSGLNIARNTCGGLAIPAADPISGGGDIGYFRVSSDTFFYHDRRFERFGHSSLKRRFSGFLYWHLKFLKAGAGFGNYELGNNPDSRFVHKKERFEHSAFWTLPGAIRNLKPGALDQVASQFSSKARLRTDRNKAISTAFPDISLEAALDRTSPGWRGLLKL